MIVALQPKDDFLKSNDDIKAFHGLVDSPVFKEGMHKAIAQFVLYHNPTTEQLEGVRRFLHVALNMAEKEDPSARPHIIRSIAELTAPKPKPIT